ncbi:MAG: cyclic nucleotide-binding domain-containing protein [Gaiella sp.]
MLATLLRDPALVRAAGALALFRIAEFGPWVGMLVYAYAQGGATETGVVSLALLVPTALFAPLGGTLVDRYGAGMVLPGAYAAQAACMGATAAALLAGAPSVVVYVAAAATATALTVTYPANAVIAPAIARSAEQLVALNAVTGWVLSFGLVAAPALAGVVLGLSGPGAVYAIGAGCLAAAAALVLPLRALAPPLSSSASSAQGDGPAARVVEGVRALAGGGPSTEIVIVLAATFVMIGAFDVLAVVLAVGELGLGDSGAGYLTAMHGLGAVGGAALALTFVARSRLVPVLLVAAVGGGLAFAALGVSVTPLSAFVLVAVGGVARSLLEVTSQTLLQRVTPTALLARIFALKEGLTMAAWALGSVLVPVLVALGGVELALLGTGAIVPIVVVARLRRLMTIDAAATVPVVTIALLRSMRLFRSLPVPALEGVAHGARTISAPGGTAVVREGEPGDRYYAIADGIVRVTRGGREVATLGRAQGFGEIALLRDVPRTATVTALGDVQLVAIDRDPFLVALTGHAETRDVAGRMAAEHVASYGEPSLERALERAGSDRPDPDSGVPGGSVESKRVS